MHACGIVNIANSDYFITRVIGYLTNQRSRNTHVTISLTFLSSLFITHDFTDENIYVLADIFPFTFDF